MKSQFMLTLLLVCIISIFAMDEGLAKINPKNIVGIWLLDEGKGETVGDSTENGHDGTIIGPPEWGEGKFGNALDVGASSYARSTVYCRA